jgi:hypothetical protein
MSLNWWVGPIVIALCGMTGCATTGPSLSSSAERLEDTSFAMERNADQSRVRQDARELSEEAREFRRTLMSNRADRGDVREEFDDVSRSYHSLRDEVERARDHETDRYFEPVTNAYLDIEREIGRSDPEDRDRYARGRY